MAYNSIPVKHRRNRAWTERFENPKARFQAAGDYERLKAAAEHVAEIQWNVRRHAATISHLPSRRLYLLKTINSSLLARCKSDATAAKIEFKAALVRFAATGAASTAELTLTEK